jgi:hypothetical protein
MAGLSITLTPDIDSWTTGDAPIQVEVSGEIASGDQPFWESDGGTFDDRFTSPTYFTPNNGTKQIKITGYRVNRFDASGSVGSVDDYGTTGGKGKASGALAWDTWWLFSYYVDIGVTAFFEQEAVDNISEKAMGFISNSNYPNPTTVSGVGTSFEHAWHLYADGTAVPRRMGVSLSTPVAYKTNDRFRVTLKGSQAIYMLNGNVVAVGERVNSVSLYAYNSWKSVGGYFNNVSYLTDDVNMDSDYVSVTGLFPVQPNFTYSTSTDVGILSSVAVDGTEKRRRKTKARKTIDLQFNERPYFEYQQILDFWNAHEKHERFVYKDLVLDESYIVRFNAPLTVTVLGANNVSVRATLQEV